MNDTIKDFTKEHIPAAVEIARRDYAEERRHVPSLPPFTDIPSPLPYAQNGLGVAAFRENTLVGFLCAVSPFPHAFRSTDAVGVFSPMGANGAAPNDRAAIYAEMYQAAGEKWAAVGASSHAVSLYAHDLPVQMQFFRYGFGVRCIDAIRCIKDADTDVMKTDFSFAELAPEAVLQALPFEHALDVHMTKSPTFMLRPSDTEEEYLHKTGKSGARIFAAYDYGKIIAFLKVERDGETFLCDTPGYLHITGAFCLPEYRGRGVYRDLLQFVIEVLKGEGTIYLGVDYESINPAADRFWSKHFDVYTHSVVRRIDEHVLKQYK